MAFVLTETKPFMSASAAACAGIAAGAAGAAASAGYSDAVASMYFISN